MEPQVDHSAPGMPLVAASERLGSDAVESVANQSYTELANLNAAATDGLRTDFTLLGQDRLLELQLDRGVDLGDPAGLSEDPFPSFHEDDLPAPSFHEDDLPAPSIHDDDLPADLTTFGLGQLLELQLSGGTTPTVGQVVLSDTAGNDPLHGFAGNDTIDGGAMSGLEVVDLHSDIGANTFELTVQEVLDVTDNGNSSTITGDAGDKFDASNGWNDGGFDGSGNHMYTQIVEPLTAMLVGDPDISVIANILL